MELTFYTNPMSRGRIIRWMLEETGAPYSTVVLDFSAGCKNPQYLAINPIGKLPAITHGDAVVTECAAICAYLADAFPAAALAPPPASPARAAYYRWLFFTAGPLEAAITDKMLGVTVPDDKQAMCGYGNFTRAMDTLEYAVGQAEYLAGGNFSAADLYVGAQIIFGLQFNTIERRPAFVDYAKRLSSRPAALRAKQIDDALIAEQAQAQA